MGDAHNGLAQAWVKADASHGAYVDEWAKAHPAEVAQWIKDNPDTPSPRQRSRRDLLRELLEGPSGAVPRRCEHETDGKTETAIEPVKEGTDIQSTFFDMWRQEHADADLQEVPADMVMASGSGFDPHITLKNAQYQLDRVAAQRAANRNRDPGEIRREIAQILQGNASAPFAGLAGEKIVNAFEVNLQLRQRHGAPSS